MLSNRQILVHCALLISVAFMVCVLIIAAQYNELILNDGRATDKTKSHKKMKSPPAPHTAYHEPVKANAKDPLIWTPNTTVIVTTPTVDHISKTTPLFSREFISHAMKKRSIPDSESKLNETQDKPGLPDCGEVCQYTGTKVHTKVKTYFPKLKKTINCQNIIGRMAYKDHHIVYPPPERPPQDLEDEFTQFGAMPITHYTYYKYRQGRPWTVKEDEIDELVKEASHGININSYDDNGCMLKMVVGNRQAMAGKSGIVIGTRRPWLEAMLLAQRAEQVTTLEYGELQLLHPQLRTYSPYTYAEMYLSGQHSGFDFAASFSSLEHSGLGRYGDPINPYGDMEAMAQVWCLLKPGGIFVVGVPISPAGDDASYIKWNANRVYGPERLQHMAANWDLMDYNKCSRNVVLVLRKPDNDPSVTYH